MGIPVHREKGVGGGPDVIKGLRTAAPGSTDLLVLGLDIAGVPGNVASTVTELWSGVVHSLPWALHKFADDVDVAEHEAKGTIIETKMSDRAYAVATGLGAVGAALDRIARHFGWALHGYPNARAERMRDIAAALARLRS